MAKTQKMTKKEQDAFLNGLKAGIALSARNLINLLSEFQKKEVDKK